MSSYRREPPFSHDRAPKVGVLLVNLGTPDAPTPAAVRRYLAEFLTDPRVVEIPSAVWRPILHGIVLRTRPAQSAKKYALIWTKDGSPLLVHSLKQKALLQGLVGQRLKAAGLPSDFAPVELGMRYGTPTIADALDKLKAAGCDRILVVPLYPQYAASSTGSALDAVCDYVQRTRRVPALRTIDGFHDEPAYVKALAQNANDYWVKHGRPDFVVLSFHGLPRRTLDLGDPYHCQCHKTARLLAARARARGQALRRHVSVALRPRRVAEALYRRHADRAGQGGQRPRRRHLSGLRRRLPRDAGGDRHRGPTGVPRARAARTST